MEPDKSDQPQRMDPAAFRRAYGLSDKPQDKWTPETIKALWKATTSFDDNLKSIADAHNAALATYKHYCTNMDIQLREKSSELASKWQLVRVLEEVRSRISEYSHWQNVTAIITLIDDALAKARRTEEGKCTMIKK